MNNKITNYLCYFSDIACGGSPEGDGGCGEGLDTLYRITPTQLRAACRIFVNHSLLTRENALLKERIVQLENVVIANRNIVYLQNQQITQLKQIIVKKDDIIANVGEINDGLRAQLNAERRDRKKYALMGAGAGVIVAAAVVMVLR